jgi:hypothetical protein
MDRDFEKKGLRQSFADWKADPEGGWPTFPVLSEEYILLDERN